MRIRKYFNEAEESSKDKIRNFFIEHPNPKDKDFHAFAEKIGMEPDDAETIAYSILTELLKGEKK
jgi:hypothetical protein